MEHQSGLTVFGKTMRDLAEKRGAETWTAITRELHRAGWEGSRGTLSHWARGKYHADYEMLPYFVKAFDLNSEEQLELAKAFAYGQGFSVARRSA